MSTHEGASSKRFNLDGLAGDIVLALSAFMFVDVFLDLEN